MVIGENNNQIIEEKFYGDPTFSSAPVIKETRYKEQGLLGGLGTKYKGFSFEARYELGNGISTYSGLKSITKRYFFLCGYRFGK